MFEITTGRHRTCDGITRRDALRVGALGFFGLTLPNVLQLQARADDARDVNCILLWLNGGPSHIDMFDPKPDAPAEIRGEFGVVETNVKGTRISDQLPRLAKQADRYSILRVTSPDSGHETATSYLLSGYKFTPSVVYPAYGSVVAREKGFRNGLPPYAHLGGLPFGYGTAGYMGSVYNPFEISGDPNSKKFSVRDVTPPGGVDLARIERRRNVLTAIDDYQRKAETARPIRTMDEFYARAYDLVTSPVAKKAFNLQEEPEKLRDEYGRHTFGQSCLLARRLIEAGVRFVTVNDGGWDTHTDNFRSLRNSRLPQLDAGYAALVKDLHERGMLANTLVICMGEFGRTPRVNSSAGRDHWGQAMFVTMGGGGVKTGVTVGETDANAEMPKDRPTTVEDVAATIYRAIGIDTNKAFLTSDGRPIKIADGGTPVEELF
jgi:Protein of unknown function (DUF1501)